MKQVLKQFGIVIILLSGLSVPVQAEQVVDQGNIYWFSSVHSGLLNRSSVELASNHVNRGIYFAHLALEKKLNPIDELIANHNLCMGYLASDKTRLATDFCAHAFELAQGPYCVVKVRGAYLLQGLDLLNTHQKLLSPLQVIVSNFQQQKSNARLALSMK